MQKEGVTAKRKSERGDVGISTDEKPGGIFFGLGQRIFDRSTNGNGPPPPEKLVGKGGDGYSEVVGIVNKFIFDRMHGVFAALVEASERTNNYIVVDRTRSFSLTAELLLEIVLGTTNSRSVVIVIDRMSRMSQKQQDQLVQIKKKATPWHEGVKPFNARDNLTALYDLKHFKDPWTFKGDLLTFKRALPLIGVGEEHIVSQTTDVCPRRTWSYHYSQYLFSSGTHYIILPDEEQVVNLDALGTVGRVFASGGTQTYHRMSRWLQSGRPSVMLNNTGGVTQAFVSLHNSVKSVKKQSQGDINFGCDNIPSVFCSSLTLKNSWVKEFGFSYFVWMQDLQERAPAIIKEGIVSVDILTASAEDVLHVVTGCFASAPRMPELGLRTAESVLRAWSQHMVLYKNAEIHGKRAGKLFCMTTVLLLITAALTAHATKVDLNPEDYLIDPKAGAARLSGDESPDFGQVINVLIICLPVLSTIVATMTQRRRSLQKWCVLHTAAMRIVAEIYKFRVQVIEYSSMASRAAEVEGEEDWEHPDTNTTTGLSDEFRVSRTKFVLAIQSIFTHAMEGEMSSDAMDFDAAFPKGVDVQVCYKDGDQEHQPTRQDFKSALHQHVRTHLLGLGSGSDAGKSGKTNPDTGGIPGISKDERDDLKSMISVESYMECRARPILRRYCKRAPYLSRLMTYQERLSMLASAIAVALAFGPIGWHWPFLSSRFSSMSPSTTQSRLSCRH